MEIRVVEHEIEVPLTTPEAADDDDSPEWQDHRYRVCIADSNGYTQALSGPMSMEQAAKLATGFKAFSEADIQILPPTHEFCAVEEDEDDDEDEDKPANEPTFSRL
jgi:hypothetical protein